MQDLRKYHCIHHEQLLFKSLETQLKWRLDKTIGILYYYFILLHKRLNNKVILIATWCLFATQDHQGGTVLFFIIMQNSEISVQWQNYKHSLNLHPHVPLLSSVNMPCCSFLLNTRQGYTKVIAVIPILLSPTLFWPIEVIHKWHTTFMFTCCTGLKGTLISVYV